MRIGAVRHAVPSTAISNDDLFAMVAAASSQLDEDQLALVQKRLRQFLRLAGTKVRYFALGDEKPLDLVLDAGERALGEAGVAAEDVDFLIYTGVGRGWLEPATANVVQSELGLFGLPCRSC